MTRRLGYKLKPDENNVKATRLIISNFFCSVFKDESAAGFAIYKFFQSAFAAAAFFYSNVIDLPYQLIALGVLAVLGTICFCTVELRTRSRGSYDNAADLISGSTPTNPDEDNSCGIVSSPVTTTSDDVRA